MAAALLAGIEGQWEILALSSTAIFLAAIVRGFSGFGFSLLSITAISLLMPIKDIVPSIFLLEIAASMNLIPGIWREIDGKSLRWLMLGIKTGSGSRPLGHRFQPGNPGRPKGSRNKLGEHFISALAEDFAQHGAAVIERVRIEQPAVYVKVVASLLPKDVNLNVNNLDNLTDEQLLERLRVLTKQVAPL